MTECAKMRSIPYTKHGDHSQDKKVLEPWTYLIYELPTEKLISRISKAFNHWMDIPEDKLQQIEDLMQLLFKITLLYDNTDDDIQDKSEIRGGIPVAHLIYGVPRTVKASSFAYIIFLEKVLDLGHPDAVKVYIEEGLDVQRGDGLEVYHRENFICPTEEEYMQHITKKCSPFILLPVRWMQLFSEDKRNYRHFVELLATIIQIRDDYINFHHKKYMDLMGYCSDFTEGKFGFPIIHAIRSQPNDTAIIDILRQRTRDLEVKEDCVSLLKKSGSLEYTKSTLQRLIKQAREEAKEFGKNQFMDDLLGSAFNLQEIFQE